MEDESEARVIPLFGRDEMNLIEIPFGPISPGERRTLEVNHTIWDAKAKKEVRKRLLVTGSEAFGLPRPVDDRVLVGLKALTYETGFKDRKVHFSRHHLCRTLGWNPDGRAYRRVEESLDRIAGTTLKFKNSWWDKGEKEWQSHTFHLIDNVELCSHDRYQKIRSKSGRTQQSLSSIVWNEVVWKSFGDGFIKKIDMEMFRRISNGNKRDVACRLYRVLDKKFYNRNAYAYDVEKLCIGILGLNARYVSKMIPALERAGRVLVDCEFLESFRFRDGKRGKPEAVFIKKRAKRPLPPKVTAKSNMPDPTEAQDGSVLDEWLTCYSDTELESAEDELLASGFGDRFEIESVRKQRTAGLSIRDSGFLRKGVLKRYLESNSKRFSAASS